MRNETNYTGVAAHDARRTRYFLWLTIAVICGALIATFRIGLDRGLSSTIGTGAWGRTLFAVGAAITQMEHGGYGYTISNVIETVLTYGGLTANDKILVDLGTKFPDNLHSSTLINTAISKAVHFKWPFNPDENVRGSGGDDLGLVDYVRLSFYLFGYNLLSLYLTYFAILAISISAFIYALRFRPGLLALLVITCVAQVFLLSSSIFDPHRLGSVADPRFLSVLAIIPGMHLGYLIVSRARPTTAHVALAILQSIILIFALWIRATAIWVIVAVSLLAIAVTTQDLLNRRFNLRQVWGFGVLLSVWFVHAIWTSMALHPIYKEKREISHHVVWHAIFYQLQFHPNWKQRYAAEYDNMEFDELPLAAAKKYLMRHPPRAPEEVYLTEDRKHLKVAASEAYIRAAFVEFMEKDPKFVLETYFIYSPIRIFYILGPMTAGSGNSGIMRSLRRDPPFEYALLGITFCMLAGFLATEDIERRLFSHGVVLLTATFFVSLLPILPAPDFPTVVDQYLALLTVLGSWAVLTLCAGMRMCIRLGRKMKDKAKFERD
jgi:hypothetical protein